MNGSNLNPTLPPLDPQQLGELARFFEQFGDWFRAALRDTEDAAKAGGRRDEPEGVRSVSFFGEELVANLDDFSVAAARLLAMAEAGRPVYVRRVDFGDAKVLPFPRPALATVNGERPPAA